MKLLTRSDFDLQYDIKNILDLDRTIKQYQNPQDLMQSMFQEILALNQCINALKNDKTYWKSLTTWNLVEDGMPEPGQYYYLKVWKYDSVAARKQYGYDISYTVAYLNPNSEHFLGYTYIDSVIAWRKILP